jgi:hypothetical protein
MDELLQRIPEQIGESREDERRVLFLAPLAALYRAKEEDCLVEEIHVWKIA